MAVTNEKKLKEEQQQAAAYTGLEGVSQNTAQQLGKYQQGYTPSQNVTQAQQTWRNVQAQKPQGYTSKYAGALENILQQIQNPQQFKYEFNGDNLFKAYSDLYTQQGKQASLDTMGQAAGLTGGYGNSYAQNVGNQAYQQYLTKLYDVGLDLHDRAYQKYLNDLGNQKDIYNILMGADQNDYGRYRDTVADWQNEEANAYNRYANERTFDYGTYSDMLNYYTGLAQVENADYSNEQERQEAIRQFNAKMAEQIRSTDLDEAYRRDTLNYQKEIEGRDYAQSILDNNRKYDYQTAIAILQNGQMPSAALLESAGLSQEDAAKLIIQATSGGSGGPGGGKAEIYPYVSADGKTTTYYVMGTDGKLYTLTEEEAEKAVKNKKATINNIMNDYEKQTTPLTSINANAASSAASVGGAKTKTTTTTSLTDILKKKSKNFD